MRVAGGDVRAVVLTGCIRSVLILAMEKPKISKTARA